MVKNPLASAGDVRDAGSIPGSGGGHGNPLQYSCLENLHGQRSLVGYSPWDHKELDMTEQLSTVLILIQLVLVEGGLGRSLVVLILLVWDHTLRTTGLELEI